MSLTIYLQVQAPAGCQATADPVRHDGCALWHRRCHGPAVSGEARTQGLRARANWTNGSVWWRYVASHRSHRLPAQAQGILRPNFTSPICLDQRSLMRTHSRLWSRCDIVVSHSAVARAASSAQHNHLPARARRPSHLYAHTHVLLPDVAGRAGRWFAASKAREHIHESHREELAHLAVGAGSKLLGCTFAVAAAGG